MRLCRFVTQEGVLGIGRLGDDDEVIELMGPTHTVPLGPHPAVTGRRLSRMQIRLLAPIARPPKVLCVARNYARHAAEMGAADTARERGAVPVVFNKQATAICGPIDPIVMPDRVTTLDFEGELAVVIGERVSAVDVASALSYVAGYSVINDVSVREWQRMSPTMTLGKSFDSHGPFGPWLVTADEIPDPHALVITTTVNGEVRQRDTTASMMWSIPELISVLSHFTTLEPGDLIATGTPAGVGAGSEPPRFLQVGDVVEVEVSGVGVISNTVVAQPDGGPTTAAVAGN